MTASPPRSHVAVQDPLTFVWLIDDNDMKLMTDDIKPPAIEPLAIEPPVIEPIPEHSVRVMVRSRKMAFFVFILLKALKIAGCLFAKYNNRENISE